MLRDIAMQRAAETPDKLLYRFVDGNLNEKTLLTYGELDARARRIACTLSQWTQPGARVIVALDSDSTFVSCVFGCLYAARVVVPAPAPRRSDEGRKRVLSIVRDAAPELVVVTSEQTSQRLRSEAATHNCRIVTSDELLGVDRGTFEPRQPASQLAILQYTSGSTADPKGVMLTETALQANLEAIRVRFGSHADSHGVSWLPMHHDMGLIGFVLEAVYVGASATLLSAFDFIQRPARWLQAISRYRAAVSGGSAFAYSACLDRIRDDQLQGVDLSCWQVAFVGAERVSQALLRRFEERFAPFGLAPGTLRACYGLAEATLMVTCPSQPDLRSWPASDAHDPNAVASCGECIADHELICVDAQGQTCDEGVTGEIWVRGPSIAAGYFGRDQESAQVFGAYCAGRGPYLRTGDLGLLRDGQLFVVGRIKDVVIVRARKFAPEDLETSIALSHPALAACVSVAFSTSNLPDHPAQRAAGHADSEALIVVQELSRRVMRATDRRELRECIREQLVNAHGVSPAAIVFVVQGTIPRTTSGKVQRWRCRELFEQGSLACLDAPQPALEDREPPLTMRTSGDT